MKTNPKNGWRLKSGVITCWILLCLILSGNIHAQSTQADPQDHVAHTFIQAIFSGDYKQAWNLFDPEAQKPTPLEQFSQVAKKIDSVAKGLGFGQEVLEFMRGFRTYQNGQTFLVYTYKFKGDVSKGMLPSAMIDIAFKDKQTTLVYGIIPKFPALSQSQLTSAYVSTSSGKEITLENEQKWQVEGKTVNVNELALVLDNVNALLAIKVWDEEAKGITQQRA